MFLCLWFINMIFPWILHFIPDLTSAFNVNGNYYWSLCYFGGFLGYWILGMYLMKYPIKIGLNFRFMSLILGTIAYPVAIYLIKSRGGDTSELTDNLQIGSAILVAFMYTIMQNVKIRPRLQSAVSHIAKYSFGIYLTHIYLIYGLYWHIFSDRTIHVFPRTFLIAFLTLLTGYLLTYLLSLIPKGRYFIGV